MLNDLGLAGIPQPDRGRMCLFVRISLAGTGGYGADSEVCNRLMKNAIASPHGYKNKKMKQISVAQTQPPDVMMSNRLFCIGYCTTKSTLLIGFIAHPSISHTLSRCGRQREGVD